MSKFKAVVFDLDGTLLNTIDDLGDSMNSVLENMGYPIHTIPEYKIIVGKGLRNLVTNVIPPEHRNEITINLCLDKMLHEYGNRWGDKTRPYEGIPQLLDTLTERNIKLAILSNKAHHITLKVTGKFLNRWNFKVIFGERPDVPRKPDPASAIEIIDIMKISSDEIIYLGDSGSDMETAIKAGMFPVGALWGFRDGDELLEHGAKKLIQTPAELLNIL